MAITDKTRKRLWAASGGRCAKCRCRLVHRGSQADGDAVVGDECHIVGRTPTSARAGEPIPGGDMDGYDNLILLCASDHRLIDSQPGRFPTATVCELKGAHERWVEQSLQVSVRAQSETVQLRMTHARTGKELLDAVAGDDALQFDYCEPQDVDEEAAIAELSDELQDCDIISELGGAERVRAASRMSELLRRLGEHGMFVWWGHVTRQWPTPAGPMPYHLAVIEVRRMAQDQELITAHLQDIHDEMRRRGCSTERAEALRDNADLHPVRDETDHSHSPRRGRLGNETPKRGRTGPSLSAPLIAASSPPAAVGCDQRKANRAAQELATRVETNSEWPVSGQLANGQVRAMNSGQTRGDLTTASLGA